jgi:putative membrane protein insertion efficiency factor
VRAAALALFVAYRRFSATRPPRCRFVPSCSAYAAEAIARDGAWRGALRAAGRLLRCHPLGGAGYDPP